jgi:hypothetical protein
MTRSDRPLTLLALLLAACFSHAAQPDLGGWWTVDLPIGKFPTPFIDAPFKPQLAPVVAGMAAAFDAAVLPDPVAMGARPLYCALPSYNGFNGGFENDVEFLFTPGRLTITNEGGMIRRVAMGVRSLPADIDPTRHGTAVGHWEGRTLVIETAGLRADNPLNLVPFRLGAGAHVVERITLTDANTLEIALTLTAPAILAKPFEKRLRYTRDRDHEYHEYSVCEEDDRTIDPVSGRQRFEMTPPGDLPPPPAR